MNLEGDNRKRPSLPKKIQNRFSFVRIIIDLHEWGIIFI